MGNQFHVLNPFTLSQPNIPVNTKQLSPPKKTKKNVKTAPKIKPVPYFYCTSYILNSVV